MANGVKTIKNMKPEVWNEIKAESAKRGMNMAEFLEMLVKEHKKSERKGKIPKSMFGAHPWLKPFDHEKDRMKFRNE